MSDSAVSMATAAARGRATGAPQTAPPIQADAEASLPLIIEEVKRQTHGG